MIYVYRDKYNYLHGINKEVLNSDITKYTKKYIEVAADISKGGFLTIFIDNKKYTIIDDNSSVLLLYNNMAYLPSEANMVKIRNFYVKYNIDTL